LPYFTITPTFSICETHGRIAGEHFACPQCGKEAEVYSRIVGYYRPVQNWNKGKKAEFSDRHEYSVELSLMHEGNSEIPELKVKPQSFMFFYSDTCPKCPPVKNFVKELKLEGNFINVFDPAGMKLAEELEIRNLPSVVFFDKSKNVLSKAHTILEVKECL
jgi:ribonucleoside-triphosphate reductase